MPIWSAEIKELEKLYESLKVKFPELEKELGQLIKTEDANVVMLYSRRCLEVIITDLCECELNRPRKTEPLKGIIDKLHKEEKVPSYIITSMHGLNDLSTYGAHPKDFDPEQVKPVLVNLDIIIKWYLKYKNIGTDIKTKPAEEIKQNIKVTKDAKKSLTIPKKRLIGLVSGLILLIMIVVAVLLLANITGNGKPKKEIDKSVAILPFENMGSDEEYQWFGDAMTDVIINQLTKISGLRVLGRTSTLKYKDVKKSISEIGKELGVSFIIEGTVQKQANKIRISAQLIRVSKEAHIWSDLYDKEWGDIFNIQTDIAKNIASNLKTILLPEEIIQIENLGTNNDEALRLYCIGNYMMYQATEEAYIKAVDNYQQAINLDPNFAKAYAGLASAYTELAGWMVSSPSSEYISKAIDCALKAVEIDKDLGEAYFMLGYLDYLFKWNWIDAEQAFRKGIGLTPNYIYGRICYANFLTAMGRFKESIEIGQKTLELSPVDPIVYNELAFAMFFNGQDTEVQELLNKSLSLDPNFSHTLWIQDWYYLRKGVFNQVISHWEKLIESSNNDFLKIPSYALATAGEALMMAGRRDEASNILNELNRRTEKGNLDSPVRAAYLLNKLGEEEKAIDLLEMGFVNKSPSMVWIKIEFQGDSIRSNIRFKKLLRKMGFNE